MTAIVQAGAGRGSALPCAADQRRVEVQKAGGISRRAARRRSRGRPLRGRPREAERPRARRELARRELAHPELAHPELAHLAANRPVHSSSASCP